MGTGWEQLVTAKPGTREYYGQMAEAARIIGRLASERMGLARAQGIPLPVIVPIPTPDAWFWSRADRLGDCWTWIGRKAGGGYGRLERNGRAVSAHRVAWELVNGPIPPGKVICHHCDNPPCIRPDHLFLGSQADNIRDALRKGRHGSLKQLGRKRGPYRKRAA